jgi:hypothetical protein
MPFTMRSDEKNTEEGSDLKIKNKNWEEREIQGDPLI